VNFLIGIILILTILIFAVNALFKHDILNSLLFALAIAIGIAPEMLPVIITIGLSKGARIMSKKEVIVKRLIAIEDLGNMDILCTDKTGTITEGNISLHNYFDFDGNTNEKVLLYAILCNSAIAHGRKIVGNPVDVAILQHSSEKLKEKSKLEIILPPWEQTRYMGISSPRDLYIDPKTKEFRKELLEKKTIEPGLSPIGSWLIQAYIKKLPNGKYRIYSEKGKKLGDFASRKKAVKRLRQIEFFKHKGSEGDAQFNEQISIGERVEREHSDTIEKLLKKVSPELSEEEISNIVDEATVMIAADHLKEMKDYYTKLKEMESSAEVKNVGAKEKSHAVNEPVRPDNFNLFNTDMPDACPTDVFTKVYNTVKPLDSGDETVKLFE
jgi:magnesium-transporting ATPase (P-type)